MSCIRRLFCALLALTVTVCFAQTRWQSVSSGTPNTLWGVCYGGGQFVAVGEHGTILTSPDGLTWTARTSGTNVWLTAVAYGLGNYIAVGDAGTILKSYDGVDWSAVPPDGATTPLKERLNVVTFCPMRRTFVAAGEHSSLEEVMLPARIWIARSNPISGNWRRGMAITPDVIVVGGQAGLVNYDLSLSAVDPPILDASPALLNISGIIWDHGAFTAVGAGGAIGISSDGVRWSLQTSNTTANLQALVAFNNSVFAVGENGTIVSRDVSGTWQQRTSPIPELLLGAAASDTAAVIVGGSGTILRAMPDVVAPTIVATPSSVTETLGGAASFTVTANGSLPMSYQWYHDGAALAGETSASLIRAPLTPADAGSYSVRITNGGGTVMSGAATLSLLSRPAAVVDPTFKADSSLSGSPSAVISLPDRSVVIGVINAADRTAAIVKLNADGSVAREWKQLNLFMQSPYVPAISSLVAQDDGGIIVGGLFVARADPSRQNLIRLNADGTLDTAFTPDPAATANLVNSIALNLEGRIVIANGGTTPLQLLSSGERDPAFHPQPLPPYYVSRLPNSPRYWAVKFVAVPGHGQIVVGAEVSTTFTAIQPSGTSRIFRLKMDGANDDLSFPPYEVGGFLDLLGTTDDGSIVIATSRGSYFAPQATITRLFHDGGGYPGYQNPSLARPIASCIFHDGRVITFSNGDVGPRVFISLGATDSNITAGIGRPTVLSAVDRDHLLVGGDFTVYNGVAANRVARVNLAPSESVNPPRILDISVDRPTPRVGEPVTIRTAVTGSADLTYEWTGVPGFSTSDPLRTTSPVLTFSMSSPYQASTIQLIVYNPQGKATAAPISITVLPDAPMIVSQPTRVSAQSGRDLTLTIESNQTAGPCEYIWSHNGQVVSLASGWATGRSLPIPSVTAADAGTYTVTVRNAAGVSVTTDPILVTVDDSSRFVNLSTLGYVDAGEQTLITGFTITGTNARTVVIRGVGPGLTGFGVPNALPDPQIALFDAKGAAMTFYADDDWSPDGRGGFSPDFAKLGAFALDPTSKDAAIIPTLAPGSYTVQLSVKAGQSGMAMIEIYEDDNDAARMTNLSARVSIQPDAPATSGFVIRGPASKRVLIRAAGPALRAFGVGNLLVHPRVTLKRADGTTILTNSGWGNNANADAIAMAAIKTGAFPLGTGSTDSALLVMLDPGSYTLIVESTGGESGIALLETYEVE